MLITAGSTATVRKTMSSSRKAITAAPIGIVALIQLVLTGDDADPVTTLSEGLIFARLAAAHGDVSDDERLVGMLTITAFLSGEDGAAELRGEAMARVAMLADAGVEAAEFQLASDAEQASPEIMALAQAYRGRMMKTEKATA